MVVSFHASSLRAEEPFDYFQNSWNVIGLKDYNDGTRITPDNELLLAGGDKVQLRFGKELTPLSRKQTKTLFEGWMPVILLSAQDGAVRYDFTLWATPLPTVKDWQKAFDWPTEGENFLNWITVKVDQHRRRPGRGEVRVRADRQIARPRNAHETGRSLPASRAKAACGFPLRRCPEADAWNKADPKLWLERTVEYWQGVMAGAAKIEVPCRKATDALLAAHVCQLIASDHGVLHGGEGFYDEFYIRDGAYQIMELEEAGLNDAAAQGDRVLPQAARGPTGVSNRRTTSSTPTARPIWALWQYAKITGDRAWLAKVYPQMLRACRWTMKTRRQAPADSPFAGLLPDAFADGEFLWDGKHHIVGYDLWNLRGLLCTADAARSLGKDADAKELARRGRGLSQGDRRRLQADRRGLFPAQLGKGRHALGQHRNALADRAVRRRRSPRDRHDPPGAQSPRRRLHRGDDPVGRLTKDAIHPYMSAYTTMASLVRGEDEQVVEDFYWYLLHSTAAHAFPEGIFYKRQFAWSDTIPHVTGASNYAILLRHMLVHEQGDELHLLAAVPDWWLGAGQEIRIENAPTHFGPMSLLVRGTPAGVEVQLTKPVRNPPKRIVLHLPTSRPLSRHAAGRGRRRAARSEHALGLSHDREDLPAAGRKIGATDRKRPARCTPHAPGCEKMGTGSEPVHADPVKPAPSEVPVPIFSQRIRVRKRRADVASHEV